jgi:hypothetical protein
LNVGGWSDKMLEVVSDFLKGGHGADSLVAKIKEVAL